MNGDAVTNGCYVHGQRRGVKSASARPAAPRALQHTYSIVSGQRATTGHHIFIFPLHAFVHSHLDSRLSSGNLGVAAEHTWTLRLRATSYDLGGKITCAYLGSATNTPYTYDYERQLSLGTGYGSSYTFDYEHRLSAIGTTQFSYDGSGNRLQAVRGGVTTRYIYDASGNLLAEADGNNVIQKYYIHGAGLLAMVTPTDQIYCYHYNATGSTMAMTDQSQTVVNKYRYDPFGNVIIKTEGVVQPFTYVGQLGVMTEPNGFYYMRARYYDPQVGRFISEDPIGFEGGDTNLMAYVGNNPVMGVDPEGKAGFHQHFWDGFVYGVSRSGLTYGGVASFIRGVVYGVNAMAPDLGSHKNNPVYHATRTNQEGSAQAAINRSSSFASQQGQSGTVSGIGTAIHVMRDVTTHAGTYFPEQVSAAQLWTHVKQYDLGFTFKQPKGF
jgi:RHS repeat-associated protein